MAKKIQADDQKLEREYIIPLREGFSKVPKYRRAKRAISEIKKFIARHMKIRDRDLDKVRIDRYLNEYVWFRGIKKPPIRIKVKAIKEGEIVRVELSELPTALKFKKQKEEKSETKATVKKKVKSDEPKEVQEEQKESSEDKKEAVVEVGKEMEKAAAKQAKHQASNKPRQPKHQFRQALEK